MNFFHVLVTICGFFAPLQHLRVLSLNLTFFDLLLLVLLLVQIIQGSIRLIPCASYWAFAFGICVTGSIATLFAVDSLTSVGQLVQWIFILFVCIPALYSAFLKPNAWLLFSLGVLVSGWFLGIHAVLELITGNAAYAGGRYVGFMGSPQPTSFVLSLVYCYAISLAIFLRLSSPFMEYLVRAISGGLCMIVALIVLYAASRTGILAILLVSLVALFLARRINDAGRKGRGNSVRIVVAFSVLVMTFIPVLFFIKGDSGSDFIKNSYSKFVDRMYMSSSSESSVVKGRVDIFNQAYESISPRALLVGYGFENYVLNVERDVKPHNVYMLYLVEAGVVFVVFLCAMQAVFIARSLKLARRVGFFHESYRVAIACTLLTFVVMFVVGFFNTSILLRFYWIGFAGCLALYSSDLYGQDAYQRSDLP